MINFQKKQVKIISLIIAAVFVLSIVALGVTQYRSVLSMGDASNSNVGKVTYQQLLVSHPSYQPAVEKYQQYAQELNQQFQEQMPKLNPQQQQELMIKLQGELQAKQKELLDPINKSVNDTIKEVADKKGLTVVVNTSDVLYGGQDITADVLKKLQSKGDVKPAAGADNSKEAPAKPADKKDK